VSGLQQNPLTVFGADTDLPAASGYGAERNRRRSTKPNFRNFSTGNLQKWKDWREGPGIEPGVFQCNVSGAGGCMWRWWGRQ